MPQVSDLLSRIRTMQEAPPAAEPRDSASDLATLFLASQNAMADILTRNFDAQIVNQCRAIISQEMGTLERRIEGMVISEARIREMIDAAIAAIELPEMPEMEMEDDEEEPEEAPQPITIQRKDGVIATATMGGVVWDVVRNKAGLIKEVRPRG